MGATILVHRGTAAGLPTLLEGEPGFTTDTHEFYIGSGAGNILVSADGVTDGDKGDVTVSSSGATWEVESVAAEFALLGDLTPAAFSGEQNDYNPTGLATASTLRLDSSASSDTITGLAGGSDGRIIVIHNIGTTNFSLVNESANSLSANRFTLPDLVTVNATIEPDQSVVLQYDGTVSRWRLIASGGVLTGSVGVFHLASNSISTAKIQDGAVSYAKMQSVSATSRILCRKTAAAGVVEEGTLSETLDFVGSPAQGDLLYRGAATWTRLGAGSYGQVLRTPGAAANPAWAGGMTLLATATASASATINFTLTGWTNSAFAAYMITFSHVAPATDNVTFWLRTSTNGGTSYDAGASDYSWTFFLFNPSASGQGGDAADSEIELVDALGNAANETTSGYLIVSNPSAAKHCAVQWFLDGTDFNGSQRCTFGAGRRVSAADVDAIRFLMSSGNIASGEFRLYGLSNA